MKKYIVSLLMFMLLATPFALQADNYSPGDRPTPRTFATDSINGVEYPRTKIVHGADGTATEIDKHNGLPVNTGQQATAFGELSAESKTPQVAMKFHYGLNSNIDQVLVNHASSSVSFSSGLATVTAAGAAETFAQIRSLDTLRYGPGQGASFLGTAAFTTGVADSTQVIGAGDDDEGFFFGYNGTAFGVHHRGHGSLEVKSIEITGAADGDGGTFTITMDGDAVTVTVSAGDTIATVCRKIVALSDEFGDAGRGWEVHTDDNITIEFISLVAEDAGGSFAFADVDSGVTAGAFSETVSGVAPTINDWIPQASWNVDTMDGSGPSGITLSAGNGGGAGQLDINNLNVFKISFQFLGAGQVCFFIESPDTGDFILVHRINRPGTSAIPVMSNPTLHLTAIAKTESGYSGGALSIKTASMSGFIEGKETEYQNRESASGSKSTNGTTLTNILTIHNELDFGGVRNKMTVFLDFMSVSALGGSKTVNIQVLRNVTEVGGTVSLTKVDSANSPMEFDTAGTTIVGGQILATLTLGANSSINMDLSPYNVHLRPGDRITFAGKLNASGTDSTVTISTSWKERL